MELFRETSLALLGGTFGIILGIMLLKSFGILWAGEAFDVYQFGTYVCTYWPTGACDFLDEPQRQRYSAMRKSGKMCEPLFLNIVFALYPFYQMRRIPTVTETATLFAEDVFTMGTTNHLRLELSASPSLTGSWLSFCALQQRLGLPTNRNWFEECDVDEEEVSYKTTRFEEWFREKIERVYLEVFRQVAANFVWHDEGPKIDGEKDISGEKLLLERMTLWQLGTPEAITAQGQIIQRPKHLVDLLVNLRKRNLGEESPEFLEELVLCPVSMFCGQYTLSIDLNLADLDLALEEDNASEAQRAVNAPFVGKQKAKATLFTGEAEAKVIRAKGKANAYSIIAMNKAIGSGDPTVAALQLLREGQVTFNTFGTTIPDILRSFGGPKT